MEQLAAALARTFHSPCRIRPARPSISRSPAMNGADSATPRPSCNGCSRWRTPPHVCSTVTDRDLSPRCSRCVFGEAQLEGNCAVVSTARLHDEFYGMPPRQDVLSERLFKEAAHELGPYLRAAALPGLELRHVVEPRRRAPQERQRLEFCRSCRQPIIGRQLLVSELLYPQFEIEPPAPGRPR